MSPKSRFVHSLKSALCLVVALLGHVAIGQPGAALDQTHAAVRAVMALQAEVTPGLMSSDVILGTAVGLDESDLQPALVVYVDRNNGGAAAAIRSLPPQLRGIAVRVEVTEKFRALVGKPGGGGGTSPTLDHKVKQTAPIQLGTSGGWKLDLANGYCCGGTLGSLVKIGDFQYILSNYHVLEADIVSGGNGIIAATGQAVIHPALIDSQCSAASSLVVATLERRSSLQASNVDCAIALVNPGAVRTDGSILGIGTISASTVGASLRQAVKKSGRTTGLTTSTISGLNATINVTYQNECAGGTAFTKNFTGQIVIANKGSKFLAGGDSGSLMVENVTTKPRAVGLLFAGSSTSAIANPIGEVLTFLGATMVGN
jgi:hypothetical protein